jgi:hypothetical protein
MADPKRTKKKGAKPRERRERRFVPPGNKTRMAAAIAGMLGALVLGAGVYGQWILDPAFEYAPYLVAVGAVVLALALWRGDPGFTPVRVGEAGIAIEKGNDITRLLWCDIERIFIEDSSLMAKSPNLTLAFPLEVHRAASAWILSEAARRIPDALDVKRQITEQLPTPRDTDGESLLIDAFQITGRHCAASGRPIAFEQDARLCPKCAQVYLKDQVPKKCVTCDSNLEGRAYRPNA